MSDGQVIRFPRAGEPRSRPEADELEAPIGKQPGYNFCRHSHVAVDVVARKLDCKDCGQVIDPIDWVVQLANEWDSYVYGWRDARAQIKRVEAKLADLKRQEKNAKARLARLKQRGIGLSA